jgi:hypothetical protein
MSMVLGDCALVPPERIPVQSAKTERQKRLTESLSFIQKNFICFKDKKLQYYLQA